MAGVVGGLFPLGRCFIFKKNQKKKELKKIHFLAVFDFGSILKSQMTQTVLPRNQLSIKVFDIYTQSRCQKYKTPYIIIELVSPRLLLIVYPHPIMFKPELLAITFCWVFLGNCSLWVLVARSFS